MHSPLLSRALGVISLLALSFAAAACSSGAAGQETNEPAAGAESSNSNTESGSSTDPAFSDADGYAFGVNRDQLAEAVGKAFKNASAAWHGDTLVLSVDGDVTSNMAGFAECRVLAELLKEGDLSEVEFPNGRVDCAEVLDID